MARFWFESQAFCWGSRLSLAAWVGWMQGVAVDMVISGVLLYVGLTLIGLEFAIFFAVLTALFSVIPYFGAFISGIPPVLFALTYSPGKMVHDIYRFDTPSGGHFEEFASDGARLGRQCFDKMPERKHNFGPAEWEFISGSSGRGGSVTGYYAHTPGAHMVATTKWVKWKVSVN